MTELEYKVQQLQEDVANLSDAVAKIREDTFAVMQTRDELARAMNILMPRIEALEDKLDKLINLLKSKGVI